MKISERITGLTKKDFIILISVFSIFKCALLYLLLEVMLTPGRMIGYVPDSRIFETLAKNILAGNGFSLDAAAPFTPSMFKEPVYALFIAVVYLFLPQSPQNIVLIQILLNPLTAILIYLTGRELFDERIARFSALLIAFLPIFGEVSLFVQADVLYLPLFLFFTYMMIKAFKYDTLRYYIFSGLVFGICSLCKNIMFYAYGLVFILIALGYGKDLKFNKDERPKRRFAKILIFTAGFLLIVFPWIARNIKEFKTCQISQRGGTAIWTQAATAESLSPRELKAHFLYLISGRLAQKKFPDIVGNDMGSFEYRFYNKIPFEGLKQAGLSEGEIDIFLGKEAVKKICAHPFKFIAFSTINYIQILKYFEPWSLLTLKGQNKWLSELVFPAVRFIAGIPAGLAFTLLAVLGIYFSRKYLVRYLFIVMIIGYYHFMLYFMGATPGGMQRFVLPVIPLFSFFACISIMRFFGGSGRSQSIIRESE